MCIHSYYQSDFCTIHIFTNVISVEKFSFTPTFHFHLCLIFAGKVGSLPLRQIIFRKELHQGRVQPIVARQILKVFLNIHPDPNIKISLTLQGCVNVSAIQSVIMANKQHELKEHLKNEKKCGDTVRSHINPSVI